MDTALLTEKLLNEINEDHLSSSLDTPMREDAFELNDIQKIEIISNHFRQIMHTLGLDLTDDSLKDTPLRVAKMYVKEIFSGLDPANKPRVNEKRKGYKKYKKGY